MSKLLFGLVCMIFTVDNEVTAEFTAELYEMLILASTFISNGGPQRFL